MGVHLHVMGGGGSQFLSINIYNVPVTSLSAPVVGVGRDTGTKPCQVWWNDRPVTGCWAGKGSEWTALPGMSRYTLARSKLGQCPDGVECGTQAVAVCVNEGVWGSSPPAMQSGRSLIQSPLYCGCHCHHHSHWEEHTALTPCVLRGGLGHSGL